MARKDMAGFFWNDTPPPKPPKAEKEKRTPPERTWEAPDYLPGLAEAQAFDIPIYTDQELFDAVCNGERFVFDIECYSNYFLVAFQGLTSGKIVYFEFGNEWELYHWHIDKLLWLVGNACIVGFNSKNYDIPILSLAMAGADNACLKAATFEIIVNGTRPSDVLRNNKVKSIQCNHIDLIEVAPLRASLKIYGGRMHAPRMQDLPFDPDITLSTEQIDIVRWYCVNDLKTTGLLYYELEEQIHLRERMSAEYGVDLRSRSDAQIAESVISKEVEKLNGFKARRPEIPPGTAYRYNVPSFLRYDTDLMNWALHTVANARFIVSEFGNIGMPKELSELEIKIANGVYRMGIGGLHSFEQKQYCIADENTLIIDKDVTSYYPAIILNQGLFPAHLTRNFLHVYKTIVDRRIRAKREGNKVDADSLKITINGSFGKFGNMWSMLYSPQLLIQVTITGQLSLLMLIERLELSGITVLSANTDGIVIRCKVEQKELLDAIVKQWEVDTSFETEETNYSAIYSRDVNNYIAVKTDGKVKTKGAYAEIGLHKNPTNEICVDAVIAYLTKGTPIAQTITTCTDIRKFVSVRTVNGGAVHKGQFLGKAIRWYYNGEDGEIVYAASGNKVPKSDGAKPLMDIHENFPTDVNHEWYTAESNRILNDLALGETNG